MSDNREWLRSLTDDQLAQEIKYGSWHAESTNHKQFFRRQVQEAIDERNSRKEAKRYDKD